MAKVLTISVAAYNVEDSLEDTLRSLVTDPETMDRMEVLVVDDGSVDRTAEIADRYAAAYPRTFRLIRKSNGGYGSTINVSTAEAQGLYFKQLDGGDAYFAANLPDFVDFLDRCRADLVISPYQEVYLQDGRSEILDPYAQAPKGETLPLDVLQGGKLLKMHGLAFRTEVWRKLGREIPEHCFYTDMEYVFYPLTCAETVSFFEKPVYRYFLQCEGQSVSNAGIRKHYPDAVRMMWDLFAVYEDRFGKVDGARLQGPETDAGKEAVARYLVQHAAAFVYTAHIVAGRDRLRELTEIDRQMKDRYSDLYRLTGEVKRIRLMRRTGLKFYGLYRRMVG